MLEGTKSNVQENLIMRFFPPPAFLTMPSVGVDISDRSIKFLEFERVKDTYKLGAFGDVSLEKDAVVGGEIKNEEGLIDGLKDIRGKVKPMFVRASLPE